MRHSLRQISVAILATMFVSTLSICGVSAAEPTLWAVKSVSGDAHYKSAEMAWTVARAGDKVQPGHHIRTGSNAKLVLARGDDLVTLTANSSVELQPASNGVLTRMFQKLGTLMFKVRKLPNSHFEVRTPYLVALVKGTTFTVSVDDGGGAVHVLDGLVEVASADGVDRLLVRPGRTASISAERGSKLQIGAKPRGVKGKKGTSGGKGSPSKQSRGPKIKRTIGLGNVDIEQASNGLVKRQGSSSRTQTADKDGGLNGRLGLGSATGFGGANGLGGGSNLAGGTAVGNAVSGATSMTQSVVNGAQSTINNGVLNVLP